MQVWPAQGSYNMLYLPYHPKQGRTMGYAFVNFISIEAAQEFRVRWHGVNLVPEAHAKRLDIGVAEVQGLCNNLLHMRGSKKMKATSHTKHLPMIFANDGGIIDFQQVSDWMNTVGSPLDGELNQFLSNISCKSSYGSDDKGKEASSSRQ
jgi:hypothetical protein